MSSTPIQLLLTDDGNLAPVLGPLTRDCVARAALPGRRLPSALAVPGHSDNLVDEKWDVIVPDTARGRQIFGWLRPLRELRARQSGLDSIGDEPRFSVAAGMSRQEARRWRAREYESLHPDVRPGYLLIAGDLDEISHEFQQELMIVASVGRLCFTLPDGRPDRAGYEAYCAKVLDIEQTSKEWNTRPRLLLYASHDGSDAVVTGYFDLIRRCHADAEADRGLALDTLALYGRPDDHEWYTTDSDPAAQSRTLLHTAAQPHPAVLLSLTHGVGVIDPRRQRQRQGALVLRESTGRRRTEILDHTFFEQSFLPCGFWFFKACFGAGTPAISVYEPWLESLYELGRYGGNPRDALKYLAASKKRPFVARLPQTVLARPDGPLGLLGHVDMAWTYGFEALDESDPGRERAEHGPYYDVLRMVASGHRFGPAVAGLSEKAEEIGTQLVWIDDQIQRGGGDDRNLILRAWLWMRYLDLAGFILLGDPAARLPMGPAEDRTAPPSPRPAGEPSVDKMEKAVLAYLHQRQLPHEIARDAGISQPTLDRWVETYKDAGRRALAAEQGGHRKGDG